MLWKPRTPIDNSQIFIDPKQTSLDYSESAAPTFLPSMPSVWVAVPRAPPSYVLTYPATRPPRALHVVSRLPLSCLCVWSSALPCPRACNSSCLTGTVNFPQYGAVCKPWSCLAVLIWLPTLVTSPVVSPVDIPRCSVMPPSATL